jgi:fatty acid desaturase
VKLIADRFRSAARVSEERLLLMRVSPDAGTGADRTKGDRRKELVHAVDHRIVERSLFMLWIIVLILVILAVGGGLAVNNLVWLLLVVALIVAAFALMSGRRV